MASKATSGHELSELSLNTGLLNNDNASVNMRDDDTASAKSTSAPSRTKLRDFIRQFRLQSASSILARCMGSRWNADTEPRKVAVHQNRTIAALHSLLHIVPLSGAIILLVFQWTNYWVSPKDDYSSALQFAAKVHELFMQASIIEILLGLIRTRLVDGLLPFGVLSGAMQPTHVSYLWSLDYLSIFRSRAFRGWWKMLFAVALPLLIALTALVGPSSAVLMIPRRGSPRTFSDRSLYANTTDENTYPTRNISAASLESDVQELNSTLWYSEQYETHLAGWSFGNGSFGRIPAGPSEHSVTISHFFDLKRNKRLLRWSSLYDHVNAVYEANATIPTEAITSRQYAVDGMNLTESVEAPYPLVGVKCKSVSIVNTTSGWSNAHPFTSSLPAPQTLIQKVSDTVELGDDSTAVYFSPVWISSPDSTTYPLIVMLFSARTSGTWNQSTLTKPGLLLSVIEDQDPAVDVDARACAISTNWNTGEIRTSTEGRDNIVATAKSSTLDQYEPKEIALNLTAVDAWQTAKFHSMIWDLLDQSHLSSVGPEGILAAAVAMLIAKIPAFELEWGPAPGTNTEDHTPYRLITTQYGYGYGTRSTAVYLSMTVLLLYSFVAVTYMLYSLFVGVASTAWNSGLELLALALQSRKPDHIHHTGVGIDSAKTLGEGVGIRVNNDNEVELVFAQGRDFDTSGLRKLERNKEY